MPPASDGIREQLAVIGDKRVAFIQKDPNFAKSRFLQGMALAYEWYAHHIRHYSEKSCELAETAEEAKHQG